MKKAWEAPKLIVLVRGKPEESTLSGCKVTDENLGGPSYGNHYCEHLLDFACYSCQSVSDS